MATGINVLLPSESEYKCLLARTIGFFKPTSLQKRIENIAAAFQRSITTSSNPSVVEKANKFIAYYGSDDRVEHTLRTLDCALRSFRPNKDFAHPANQKQWGKLINYPQLSAGLYQTLEPYLDSPEKMDLLSRLFSQMKITRDIVTFENNEPMILVDGQRTSLNNILDRFEVFESSKYDYRLLRDKKTKTIYTYLYNGRGLEAFNPFDRPKPICQLEESDLKQIHEVAQKFVKGPSITETTHLFVIQIVSSFAKDKEQHAYLRLVALADLDQFQIKKGNVFEFCFYPTQIEKGSSITSFLSVKHAEIRALDPWNYTPCEKRFVTNIPVTEKATIDFMQFIMDRHQANQHSVGFDPTNGRPNEYSTTFPFQLVEQNCLAFIRQALKAATITVPTEMSLPSAAYIHLVPVLLKNLGKNVLNFLPTTAAKKIYHKIVPNVVAQRIEAVAQTIFTIIAIPFRVTFRLFTGQIHGLPGKWTAPIRPNLPEVLQEWQKKQDSTVTYDRPVQLTIVPIKSEETLTDPLSNARSI